MKRSPDAWTGARAPTRASKAEEEGGKALHGGTPPARHGAAPLGANESKQHRGKERTRARQVTVLPEVGLQEWSTFSKRTLTRWQRS